MSKLSIESTAKFSVLTPTSSLPAPSVGKTTSKEEQAEVVKLKASLEKTNTTGSRSSSSSTTTTTTATANEGGIEEEDEWEMIDSIIPPPPKIHIEEGANKYVLVRASPPCDYCPQPSAVSSSSMSSPSSSSSSISNSPQKSQHSKAHHFIYSLKSAEYHKDVVLHLSPLLQTANYTDLKVLGGGRITKESNNSDLGGGGVGKGGSLLIHGFSYGFGRADHNMVCEVIRGEEGGDYLLRDGWKVEWSDEGY